MIPLGKGAGALRLRLYGWGNKSVELELIFRRSQKLGFWLVDETFGLPIALSPRPAGFMGGAASDLTLMGRKYDW
jgi:hypothetical protein